MGNLSSEALVVHEEKVNLSDIVYEELLETIRKEMACLGSSLEDVSYLSARPKFVPSYCCRSQSKFQSDAAREETGLAAYLGHSCLTLEATPHPVINTLGFPPCLFHAVVPV